MAAEDYSDLYYDELSKVYEFGDFRPRELLIDRQCDPFLWRSRNYGSVPPEIMNDGHLLNSIHLCERKVLEGKNYGEKFPTIYYRLIAEAVRRKIIPVVRAKRKGTDETQKKTRKASASKKKGKN